MKHGVIFILLDAFRPDYLNRSRFLKRLSKHSALGELEEPFGFVPRPAYFGGLTPSQYGATNMFLYDPENTPFGMANFLPPETMLNEQATRKEVLEHARRYFSDFEAAYASTLDIPLDQIAQFSLAEKAPPWSPDAGYRSLFHILDEHNIPWHQCSWPYTQTLGNHSDGCIIGKTLKELDGSHGFAFIHLSELDSVGHQHGPGSRELQKTLEGTDSLCELLFDHLNTIYNSFDCLFFGDHGMLSVIESLDVQAMIRELDQETLDQIVYFIDSTLVRFWFKTERAKQRVAERFQESEKGHWLTENEGRKYGTFGIDKRNGEAYFLARPGVVFHPNFFQSRGNPPLGMHGYAPDIEDNRGLFMLYQSKNKACRDTKIVRAEQLFPLALHCCGFEAQKYTDVKIPDLEQERIAERVTYGALPATEEKIEKEIELVAEQLHQQFTQAESILLAGSFGRGEGAIKQAQEKPQAMNDYDFIVFGNGLNSEAAQTFRKQLPEQLGIDFLDVGLLPYPPQNIECSQFNFDYKYGSKVLRGNPLILDAYPSYAPSDIAIEEGLLQLANRMCGLMLYPAHSIWEDGPLKRPIINQITKTLIAIGDAYLISWKDYTSSYKTRSNRFLALSHTEGIAPEATELITQAYQYKLLPQNTDLFRSGNILAEIAQLTLKTFEHFLGKHPSTSALCQSVAQELPLSRLNPLRVFQQKIEKYRNAPQEADLHEDPRRITFQVNLLIFFQSMLENCPHTPETIAGLLESMGMQPPGTCETSEIFLEKSRVLANHAWYAATH